MNVPPKNPERKTNGPQTKARSEQAHITFTADEKAFYERICKVTGVTMAKLVRDSLRLTNGHPDDKESDAKGA